MHVLMLPSWYPEDFEDINGIFFREQAEELVACGMKVGVIAVEGVSINDPAARSWSARTQVVASQENGVIVMRAKALRPLPLAHRVNASAIVRRWKRLFDEYVSRHGVPDILHAHTMRPAGIAAHAIWKDTGIPYLVTEHRPESALLDANIKTLKGPLLETQRDAKDLVAVSPGFAEALDSAYGVKPWRSIPNLLPPQFALADIASPKQPFTFGHVSNLEPYKRVDLLIDSFYHAFKNDQGVRLRLAGESTYRQELERKVNTLGVTNIEFVGNVSRASIVEEFSRYHSFVLPSSAESFGVVFWEAMACGLPIIATDTDGGKLAVTESSGYLVPRDDQAVLSSCLKAMRENYDSFDRSAIRERAIRFCGAEAFVRNYREAYEKAIR